MFSTNNSFVLRHTSMQKPTKRIKKGVLGRCCKHLPSPLIPSGWRVFNVPLKGEVDSLRGSLSWFRWVEPTSSWMLVNKLPISSQCHLFRQVRQDFQMSSMTYSLELFTPRGMNKALVKHMSFVSCFPSAFRSSYDSSMSSAFVVSCVISICFFNQHPHTISLLQVSHLIHIPFPMTYFITSQST